MRTKTSLKAKTRKELADEYGVSPRTFRRKLKSKNLDLPNGLITPKDLEKIYQTFGVPR